jgi:DNA (cytosine-5)-methyltransferase 1
VGREAPVIHDGFIFSSSEPQMLKQIGNAVPALLGYALATMAIQVLNAMQPAASPRRSRRMIQV